jgi:hypothetical protein
MFNLFKKKQTASINDMELQKILQARHCDKCNRNCALSAPKCGRGQKQAKILIKNMKDLDNG